mgnify:CR=1 FL=1
MDKLKYLELVGRIANSVYDFNEYVNAPIADNLTTEEISACFVKQMALEMEELGELAGEVNRDRLYEAMLEAIDVLYIALGTFYFLGNFGESACNEVIEKNSKKLSGNYMKSESGKWVKKN